MSCDCFPVATFFTEIESIMILKHVILHILDKDAGNLIASQAEIDLTQPGLHDYLEKIIV